ncbi:hypothetical protein [Candidatus Synechococcus spongiarum]|uniref:hypothetical protein n=1 Tax=Candidatus Synechococcus spongiarum TaxID=431041 RepID=UPI001C587187|nr:hypothetical protein [Candidatus Synechococcus spongiarum]
MDMIHLEHGYNKLVKPMESSLEQSACYPQPVGIESFNPAASLPYGLTAEHLCGAMNAFVDFIGFINQQLHDRNIPRLETMLMPATFSSIVGEFMASAIPKHCPKIARNSYHNGHPDLVPKGMFLNDTVQYTQEGIEVKGSRYPRGWQGHNPESVWLMVFYFASNRPNDKEKGIQPVPFHYLGVFGARLEKADWKFSGRSPTSRRTITASVAPSGYDKMVSNWLYRSPGLKL